MQQRRLLHLPPPKPRSRQKKKRVQKLVGSAKKSASLPWRRYVCSSNAKRRPSLVQPLVQQSVLNPRRLLRSRAQRPPRIQALGDGRERSNHQQPILQDQKVLRRSSVQVQLPGVDGGRGKQRRKQESLNPLPLLQLFGPHLLSCEHHPRKKFRKVTRVSRRWRKRQCGDRPEAGGGHSELPHHHVLRSFCFALRGFNQHALVHLAWRQYNL